ncbi:MAG TPA: hypothetical protein VN811_02570 [Thermoanaerobaculia bacterium]|nr:hypothetical protein [Thermoanaerobaculia bacterium]
MLASGLLYAGLVLAFVGIVTIVRPLRWLRIPSRRRATVVLAAGLLLAVVAVALPAPTIRVVQTRSQLDAIVPAWQFGERHEIRVHADPARVERAIRAVTAREIRLFRLLTWIRNPRLPRSTQRENILAAPADRPILDVALKGGFMALAEEPQRELVFGTLVLVPAEIRRLPPDELRRRRAAFNPAAFAALDKPGYAKAAMNFRLEDEGGGWTRLVTETRVFATDDHARRRFAAYWRTIYPGSALIRRMWLRAIRERAERE